MKAKTFDNRPHGWSSYIYDNSGKHIGYFEIGLPDKKRADKYTNIFNSALSAHVQSELEKHGIITSPSKSFLDALSGNGKKIDADEFERMKQNYEVIMANSDVAKETENGHLGKDTSIFSDKSYISLSAHVAKETASKDKQIEIQQAHIDDQDQLIFDQTKKIADLKENINRLIDAHMGAEKEVSELKEAIAKLIQVKTRRLENAIKLTQE